MSELENKEFHIEYEDDTDVKRVYFIKPEFAKVAAEGESMTVEHDLDRAAD